jgi:adenylate cyclase
MSGVKEGQRDPRTTEETQLLTYVRSLGVSETELAAALKIGLGALGPLALDLATRPPGQARTLEAFANNSANPRFTRQLWRACGLPDSTEFPFPVTPDIGEAVTFLAGFADLVGEDTILGFTRVLGGSAARMAEALSDTARIGVEIPQRESGVPYPEVVRDYSSLAREALPELFKVIAALFRRHLILVSYQQWTADEAGAAVTLDRTVGFADLVSSSDALSSLSVAQIAAMIDRFEDQVWDIVTRAGGRIVKMIGDEAMFVHPEPTAACGIAKELLLASPHPIRIGLARGAVVALHGDYYGPTVNLAARLVAVAPASSVVLSHTAAVPDHDLHYEPIEVGALKGFVDPGPIVRMVVE